MHRPPARLRRRRSRARPLARLRRHPSIFWIVAAVAALAATLSTENLLATQEELQMRWGPVASVPVASADLPMGTALGADDVVLRDLPRLLVPEGVASDPVGRVVVEPILAGEPIVSARLAGAGATGTAALVPPGSVAVAVPRVQPLPPLEVGDRVDVLSSPLADMVDTAEVVARTARVVAVTEEAVTVAVDADDAGDVGYAALQGLATLVLQGG